MKIDPQNQKEVTNESCLIISNVDHETNFITLIYNLNDKWIEWKIDCQNILILNSGVRVNVASQLKIGMIGNIIGIVNRESELGVFCSSWLVQSLFLVSSIMEAFTLNNAKLSTILSTRKAILRADLWQCDVSLVKI